MSDAMAEEGSASSAPAPPLVLSGQRRAVLDALSEQDRRLADMYAGALHVIGQSSNPERLPQAAHSIRELIEKLPRYLDVPTPTAPPSLKEEVRSLVTAWREAAIDPATFDARRAADFLHKFERFAAWFESVHLTLRQRAAATVRRLDPLGRALPTPIEKLRIKEWQECNGFFQGVSHHTKPCTDDELHQWLDVLERFLLDRLRPRTFDDFSEIDKLIEEGERDA